MMTLTILLPSKAISRYLTQNARPSIFGFGNEWHEPERAPLGSCFLSRFRQNGRNHGATPGWSVSSKVVGEKGEPMNISQRTRKENGFPLRDDLVREREEEARKIRRLQVMMSMVMSVIGQDPNMTVEEASELAAGAKRAALAMFPDKELAFDLLYRPRLQRLIRERFRLQ
jgi:hypothetical protein